MAEGLLPLPDARPVLRHAGPVPRCRQCLKAVPEYEVVTNEETGARFHELKVLDSMSLGTDARLAPYRCGPVR